MIKRSNADLLQVMIQRGVTLEKKKISVRKTTDIQHCPPRYLLSRLLPPFQELLCTEDLSIHQGSKVSSEHLLTYSET